MTNLNTAFDVAEKYLDIPKMLDAEGEPMGEGGGDRRLRPTFNLSDLHPDTVVPADGTEEGQAAAETTCSVSRSFCRIRVVVASCALH